MNFLQQYSEIEYQIMQIEPDIYNDMPTTLSSDQNKVDDYEEQLKELRLLLIKSQNHLNTKSQNRSIVFEKLKNFKLSNLNKTLNLVSNYIPDLISNLDYLSTLDSYDKSKKVDNLLYELFYTDYSIMKYPKYPETNILKSYFELIDEIK